MLLSPSPYNNVYVKSVKGPGPVGWHHCDREIPPSGEELEVILLTVVLENIGAFTLLLNLGTSVLIHSHSSVSLDWGPKDVRYDESQDGAAFALRVSPGQNQGMSVAMKGVLYRY